MRRVSVTLNPSSELEGQQRGQSRWELREQRWERAFSLE